MSPAPPSPDGDARASGAPTAPAIRRQALVIGVAVGVFGVTFGVLATATGLSVLQAQALSVLTFTGASQFAVVGVVAAGGTPAAALGSALLLAARNGIYGLALADTVTGRLTRRLLAAQLVIDESTALAAAYPRDAERAFWWAGLSVFVWWNLGTLAGAVSGQAIADPQALGLDVAFPAGFLALLAPRLRERPGLLAALGGGVVAAVAMPFTSPGVPILLATVGALPAYALSRGRGAAGTSAGSGA